MRFRRAVVADVPAIVALVESAYRGDASRAGWTTEADLLDGPRTDAPMVEGLIADPASCFVVGDAAGEVVASMLLQDEGAASGTVYFGMFAVRPRLQGQGVGAALLAEAERVGRDDLGRRTARMTVLVQRSELIAWYVRRGYQRTGVKVPFPYGDPRVGLPRRDDLELEVLRKHLV